MTKQINQGGLANRSGNTLEQTVVGTLESKGFVTVRHKDWKRFPDHYGQELLLRNVPFRTIYQHNGATEFLLRSAQYDLEIRIECKWQQSVGSVDEKFPYLYLNCIEGMPEKDIILLVDGGGAKPGAIQWLRDAAQSKQYTNLLNHNKNIMVMNLTEFLGWANKTFR